MSCAKSRSKKETTMVGIVSEVHINLCKRGKTRNFYNCNRTCTREETLCRKVVDAYKDQVILKPLFRINVIVIYLFIEFRFTFHIRMKRMISERERKYDYKRFLSETSTYNSSLNQTTSGQTNERTSERRSK